MAATLVGLDVGGSGLRAAEYVVGRRKPVLRRYATWPLDRGVVRGGAVADPEAFTAALGELWKAGRFSTRDVAVAVANTGVVVRQMDLDWMPRKDFDQALRYQVQDALPMPVDDVNLDYHLVEELETTGEDGEPRRVSRVLLVAAARDMVDGFVRSADEAGLRVLRVDITPFALLRAASLAHGGESLEAPEAIVDVGFDTVTIVVHGGPRPTYVRVLPGLGGAAITEALQQRYDWTWEEAERTKVVVGLPGYSSRDGRRPEPGVVQHPAQEVVQAEAESLVGEIVTTLNYVSSGDDGGPEVSRVVLTGGGARLGGMRELLEQRIEGTVTVLDVAEQVRTPRRLDLGADLRTGLVVPTGLCVGDAR